MKVILVCLCIVSLALANWLAGMIENPPVRPGVTDADVRAYIERERVKKDQASRGRELKLERRQAERPA